MNPYLHHTPGRLRIKSPLIKRSPPAAAQAIKMLKCQEGVMSCDVNTVTGSLVIRYDQTAVGVDTVLGVLQDAGYIEHCVVADQPVRRLEQTLTDLGQFIIKTMVITVLERVARRSAVALLGVFR